MQIDVTRDSVCLADDVDAPHEQTIHVPETATLGHIARSLITSSYLPYARWWYMIADGAAVVFGRRLMIFPDIRLVGGASSAARDIPSLHVFYDFNRLPVAQLCERVSAQLDRG